MYPHIQLITRHVCEDYDSFLLLKKRCNFKGHTIRQVIIIENDDHQSYIVECERPFIERVNKLSKIKVFKNT